MLRRAPSSGRSTRSHHPPTCRCVYVACVCKQTIVLYCTWRTLIWYRVLLWLSTGRYQDLFINRVTIRYSHTLLRLPSYQGNVDASYRYFLGPVFSNRLFYNCHATASRVPTACHAMDNCTAPVPGRQSHCAADASTHLDRLHYPLIWLLN